MSHWWGKMKIWCLLGLLSVVSAQVAAEGIFRCEQIDGSMRFQGTPCQAVAMPEHLPRIAKQALAANKSFIWQAHKQGVAGRLYVVGSIHFGTPGMYPLPKAMTDAFKVSDTLVVEADIAGVDPQVMAALVAQYGVYQDGSTLKDHIADETWQMLEDATRTLGMSSALLLGQRPWLASMSLSALMLNQLGYQESLGVDRYFMTRVAEHDLIELEGLEFQLQLFGKLTAAEQEAMLRASLEELDQGKAFFEGLLRHWQQGDAPGLNEIFNEGFDDSAAAQRLLEVIMLQRNHRMAQKIEALFADGRVHFVVVGAGHLPGEQGVLELLEQRGFSLKQL